MSGAKDMYQQVASDSLSVETVFSALSDNKSLSLFNIIGIMSSHASDGQPTGDILISRMNLTRRQYYTRISRLVDAGLITKKRARFVLTSLGSIVYETYKTIGVAIQNRWRLQAIDTLITHGMPAEERHKLINTLLGDYDTFKEILLSTVMPNK
jgi:predicted transcriptional regulator